MLICQLQSDEDAALRSLADALDAVRKNRRSEEESEWVEKIEQLRTRLSLSNAVISRIDYGVTSPETRPGAAKTDHGQIVTQTIASLCRTSSLSSKWAFLLFKQVRAIRPTTCLELGTCLGISAAYQAAALELNGQGRLVTLEGASSLASLAIDNLAELGLTRLAVVVGRFQDTLPNVLRDYKPVDFAFVDGHHDEHATQTYFKQMIPFLSDGAVLVFDDITWSAGMKRAWNAICRDPRIRASLSLPRVGICVLNESAVAQARHFKLVI
jgi:predicted O-methyltransferase YrrM